MTIRPEIFDELLKDFIKSLPENLNPAHHDTYEGQVDHR